MYRRNMWTPEEEKKILALWEQGKEDFEIAKELKRSEHSIRSKRNRIGKERIVKFKPMKFPKILLLDIETAPLEVYSWGLFDQNINIDQIKSDVFVLCWSAKWLFNKEVMSDRLNPKEALARNDGRIIKSIWKLLDEADIIIAHNLNGFDNKILNARFVKYRLGNPSPYKCIDTLKIAKSFMRMSSNKLDYLCTYFGLHKKVETGGFMTWAKCLSGNKDALELMEHYCKNDVKILEELYLVLRPYDKTHPNIGLYLDSPSIVCPNCGSDKLTGKFYYHTGLNKYEASRCKCGAIVRYSKGSLTAKQREKIGRH